MKKLTKLSELAASSRGLKRHDLIVLVQFQPCRTCCNLLHDKKYEKR